MIHTLESEIFKSEMYIESLIYSSLTVKTHAPFGFCICFFKVEFMNINSFVVLMVKSIFLHFLYKH